MMRSPWAHSEERRDGYSSLPPAYMESGTFAGTLQNGIIKGTFQRPDGSASSTILLKRGKSYWDWVIVDLI